MCMSSQAQDHHFTQFYSAPVYLNPAFAGTSVQSRIAINYRNQWPTLPKSFVSYNFSYDQFVSKWNSGIGVSVWHDRAGTGALNHSTVALHYAYEITINRKWSVRPALNFGYSSVYLDLDNLTFSDQMAREGDNLSTIDPDRAKFADKPVTYPDFGTGLLLFSQKYWIGGALHHINKPLQSLIEKDSHLPMKLSVHGGARIKTSKSGAYKNRQFIVPAFNYKAQEEFDQLDLGLYYEYDPLVVGIWYRGLPVLKKNNYGTINHDAIAILVGYQINNMNIGYSYDITVSSLTLNSGGAHELSIVMEFASKKNKKKSKRRVIPCAKF